MSPRPRSTYTCGSCESYVADRDLLVVVNKTSREQMALHKSCAQRLIATLKPPSARAVRRAIVAQGAR